MARAARHAQGGAEITDRTCTTPPLGACVPLGAIGITVFCLGPRARTSAQPRLAPNISRRRAAHKAVPGIEPGTSCTLRKNMPLGLTAIGK